ncbi:tryptophan--tRNA ligase [[Mycoplasma] mobile]|uniref:Tryptophan--tRNA ligase n=1 Tax=Mycoplasma mobile (strain ATCC 43663 / 163K / NCTC 11711) TaxID=267748 RepID=Q6KHE3_MYCM1|nr:tryptophan--tRNA ligase [[Mycoplasma] mobile]AAT27987.1 tryptophanyl-tRNA synthetase [Mycoplasma mobile 163K]
MENDKKRVVSAITATGSLTLGNYLGAIKNLIKMQNEFDLFVFVADLHALTNEIDPKILEKNRKEVFALYLACGLDNRKIALFFQSDILFHSEMNWLILTQTNLGELNRMTQFKDKSKGVKAANNTIQVPTGLLIYPTLMAADILLYNPHFVPVGQDQKQHLELTQNIAKRLNFKFKTNFNIPEVIIPKVGAKIMDLQNPEKKMSKSSLSQKGTIFLLDKPTEAYKKILSAITDSENKIYYDLKNKKGISNLLTIYAGLSNISITQAEKMFKDENYKTFKESVATKVKEFLEEIQLSYNTWINQVEIERYYGVEKANEVAKQTILKLKKKMGLK